MIIQHKFTPDLSSLASGLKRNIRPARRAGMINVVTMIESKARVYAPVRTSNLANSGSSDVNAEGTRGTISFVAPYAHYVHEGTGLYGPHRTKIVPKNKKALYWPGAAHPVRSVKGQKPQPFLLRAAQETDIETLYVEGAENYLMRAR